MEQNLTTRNACDSPLKAFTRWCRGVYAFGFTRVSEVPNKRPLGTHWVSLELPPRLVNCAPCTGGPAFDHTIGTSLSNQTKPALVNRFLYYIGSFGNRFIIEELNLFFENSHDNNNSRFCTQWLSEESLEDNRHDKMNSQGIL